MKAIFYNNSEKRLTAPIRILIQFALFFLCLQLITLILNKLAIYSKTNTNILCLLNCETFSYALLFISIVGSITFVAKFIDKRRLNDLGLCFDLNFIPDYLVGYFIASTSVLFMLATLLATKSIEITSWNFENFTNSQFTISFFDSFCTFILVGFHEELLRFYQIKNFSEYLQGFLGDRNAIIIATILSSLILGCLHLFNDGVSARAVFLLTLSFIVMSISYICSGRAWFAMGFHAAWDFVEGNIAGLRVSGDLESSRLLSINNIGNLEFSGDQFGPDGGWVCIILLVICFAGSYAWLKMTTGKFNLHKQLAIWSKTSY